MKLAARTARSPKRTNARIEQQIERLQTASIHDLRELWGSIFRLEPHKSFGPALLRQSIAYKIQENAFGGLSPLAERQINQLIKATLAKPDAKIEMQRRIKPGAELVRVWNDKTYKVVVAQDGFAYAGNKYSSLSEIANLITGTRWNGPRFFGLRTNSQTVPNDK